MPNDIRTGWIYCDKETGEPIISMNGKLWVMVEKPTPTQIVGYNNISLRKSKTAKARQISLSFIDRH